MARQPHPDVFNIAEKEKKKSESGEKRSYSLYHAWRKTHQTAFMPGRIANCRKRGEGSNVVICLSFDWSSALKESSRNFCLHSHTAAQIQGLNYSRNYLTRILPADHESLSGKRRVDSGFLRVLPDAPRWRHGAMKSHWPQ